MRIAFFSARAYDRDSFSRANAAFGHEIVYLEPRLTRMTASLAAGFAAVCVFINDQVDAPTQEVLAERGTRLLALRSAGFNHLDLDSAQRLGLTVVRVPAYSPHAVAEHTLALILTLNRKIHRAYNRVREGNFALDGLLGFDLNGRTAGVVGTGRIGAIVARVLRSFGCRVLAYDLRRNPDCLAVGVEYVSLDRLYADADIVTLHCPLSPETYHLIDNRAIARMKPGVMLVNTSRGAVIDTVAVIDALKLGRIGSLGLDVYEEEADLFFEDLSDRVIQDDVFARLLTFPNVVVTGHQAFFTSDALANIAEITLRNIQLFEQGRPSGNEITPEQVAAHS